LRFFVGDVRNGVGFESLFGQGFWPYAPNPRVKYFAQVFNGN